MGSLSLYQREIYQNQLTIETRKLRPTFIQNKIQITWKPPFWRRLKRTIFVELRLCHSYLSDTLSSACKGDDPLQISLSKARYVLNMFTYCVCNEAIIMKSVDIAWPLEVRHLFAQYVFKEWNCLCVSTLINYAKLLIYLNTDKFYITKKVAPLNFMYKKTLILSKCKHNRDYAWHWIFFIMRMKMEFCFDLVGISEITFRTIKHCLWPYFFWYI